MHLSYLLKFDFCSSHIRKSAIAVVLFQRRDNDPGRKFWWDIGGGGGKGCVRGGNGPDQPCLADPSPSQPGPTKPLPDKRGLAELEEIVLLNRIQSCT